MTSHPPTKKPTVAPVEPTKVGKGLNYSLKLQNKSLNQGSFCVYQITPNLTVQGNPMVLAWYVLGCNPGNYAYFKWTVDYSIQWSQQGTLSDGIQYEMGGESPVDLEKGDRQSFGVSGPAYTFLGPAASGAPGTCGINSDNSVEMGECTVALAMAGRPVAAIPIQPNSAVTFTPKSTYYLSFGTFTESTVVDIATMVNSIELDFEGLGVRNLSFTLDAKNNWTKNAR